SRKGINRVVLAGWITAKIAIRLPTTKKIRARVYKGNKEETTVIGMYYASLLHKLREVIEDNRREMFRFIPLQLLKLQFVSVALLV
ncbi:hypothetical protein Zmor_008786, partial [Zophobas morio]